MATFAACASGLWSANHTWGDSSEDCIVNGGFDSDTGWTKGTNVSIAGGVCVFNSVGSSVGIRQTPSGTKILQGRTYTFQYTISGYVAGTVRLMYAGSYIGTARSANGTYTEDITLTFNVYSDKDIRLVSTSGGTILNIDDFSCFLKTEGIPADDDTIWIQQGVSVLMDTDTSAYTNGFRHTYIECATNNGAPGMLYCMDGYNGYLKIKTGYTIQGSYLSGYTSFGRLLCNSDGNWATTTPLSASNSFVIDLKSTAAHGIDTGCLVVRMYAQPHTVKYVRLYGTKYEFNAATAVNASTDVIDLGTTPPSAGTQVRVVALSGGTLPTGLNEDDVYVTRAISGNTCKLAYWANDVGLIDITAVGSGTCALVTRHTSTSTPTVNVIEDVSGDSQWSTSAGSNKVFMSNIDAASGLPDNQYVTLSGKTSSTLTLSANVNSAQAPLSRIYLVSRNVKILSSLTSASYGVFYPNTTNYSTSDSCYINCEISHNNHTSGTISGALRYATGSSYGNRMDWGGTYCGAGSGVSMLISNQPFEFSGVFLGTGTAIQGAYASNGAILNAPHFVGCTYAINGAHVKTQTSRAEIYGCAAGVYGATYGTTVNNPKIVGCSGGIQGDSSAMTECISNATIRACYTGISGCIGLCFMGEISSPAYYGIMAGYRDTYGGTIVGGANYGLYFDGYGVDCKINNITVTKCNVAIRSRHSLVDANGMLLTGNTTNINIQATSGFNMSFLSLDHDQVAGRVYAQSILSSTWTTDYTEYPVGKSESWKLTASNTTTYGTPNILELPLSSLFNASQTINVYAKHPAGIAASKRATFAIVNRRNDPWVKADGAYVASWTSSDSASWQSSTLSYSRSAGSYADLFLRIYSYTVSGDSGYYYYADASASGGGVIIVED